jgi:hypothetical protein
MAEVRPGSVVHQFTGLTPSLNRRKMACATAHNGRLRDNGNPTSRSPHPRLYDPNALGRRLLDARDRVLFPARQCAIRAMASNRQCFRVSSRKQEVRNMPETMKPTPTAPPRAGTLVVLLAPDILGGSRGLEALCITISSGLSNIRLLFRIAHAADLELIESLAAFDLPKCSSRTGYRPRIASQRPSRCHQAARRRI